jgi:hypothetical protein
MATTASTVEECTPVWIALSNFFLDTSLQEEELNWVAGVLAASPYSEAEIEEILRYEVAPVCQWNLLDIAGEWTDFDEQRLREKITPRLNKRPRFWHSKWWPKSSLPAPWKKVQQKLRILRAK